MAIAKARLFSADLSDAKSMGGLDAVDIFNHGIVPHVNSLLPDVSGGDPLDIYQNAPEDAPQEEDPFDMQSLFARRRDHIRPDMFDSKPVEPSALIEDTPYEGSRDLTTMVKSFEGFSASPYKDNTQVSIGYGTRARPGETSISKEVANQRLQEELGLSRRQVIEHAKKHGYSFSEAQIDALTSFNYNTGRLEQLTNNGTRTPDQIAEKFPQYRKSEGKVLPGLVRRRFAEQRLFKQG